MRHWENPYALFFIRNIFMIFTISVFGVFFWKKGNKLVEGERRILVKRNFGLGGRVFLG